MKKIFPERFKGQVIVLTGAARGIGKATALRAAKESARLVLTDRLEKEGREVLKAVKTVSYTHLTLPTTSRV